MCLTSLVFVAFPNKGDVPVNVGKTSGGGGGGGGGSGGSGEGDCFGPIYP